MGKQTKKKKAPGRGRVRKDIGAAGSSADESTKGDTSNTVVGRPDQAQQQQCKELELSTMMKGIQLSSMPAPRGEESEPLTIHRLVNDPTLATQITAAELELIFEEVTSCLQLCLIPTQELFDKDYEGSLSRAELKKNMTHKIEDQLFDIASLVNILRLERNDNDALAFYFQRATFHCNPQNVEMILAIMDPETHKNENIRTLAFTLATFFGLYANSTSLNRKLSTRQRCATMLLYQCAKSLECPLEQELSIRTDSYLEDDGQGNFWLVNQLLLKCSRFSKDPTMHILNHISTLNWSLILDNKRADHAVFTSVAVLLLRQVNFEECRPEVATMRQVLGSCFGLLRRVLKRILLVRSAHTWSEKGRVDVWNNFLSHLAEFFVMFHVFTTGPPPHGIERELDILFSCAHASLCDAKPHFVTLLAAEPEQLQGYDLIIDLTRADLWTENKKYSSSARQEMWERETTRISSVSRKQVRRAWRDRVCAVDFDPSAGTRLCVNCFTVEEPLQKCSLCNEVSYCGRSCQREHWKRTHRYTCTGK